MTKADHAWITPRVPVLATLAPVAWCHRCGVLRSDARDLAARAFLAFAPNLMGGLQGADTYRYLTPGPTLGAWSSREPPCR